MSPQAPGEVTFTVIAEKMTTHFQPAPSEIVQRFRFNTQVCRPHETVAAYISQLKQLAEYCNFGNEARLNEMIRDHLVYGIANEKWQQRLLAEDDLSYDKAIIKKDGSVRLCGDHKVTVNQATETYTYPLPRI